MLSELEQYCIQLSRDFKGLLHCPWSKGHAKHIYYQKSHQLRYERRVSSPLAIECGDCGGRGQYGGGYDEPPEGCWSCECTGLIPIEVVQNMWFQWKHKEFMDGHTRQKAVSR